MHGIIFMELERFVRERAGPDAWLEVCQRAGVAPGQFTSGQSHPDALFQGLLRAASGNGETPLTVQEAFGRFLAPSLLRFGLFQGAVQPGWGVLEIIRRVQSTIHAAVVLQNRDISPPMIQVELASHNTLRLVYRSPRRLCRMLQGIVTGLGEFFAEPLVVIEESCQLSGSAACEFTIVADRATFLQGEDLEDQAEILTKLALINRSTVPLQGRIIQRGVHFLFDLRPLAIRQHHLVVRPPRDAVELLAPHRVIRLESPLFAKGIRGRIEVVDPQGPTFACTDFHFDDGLWERGDLRVEPANPVNVALTGAEEAPIPCQLADISLLGANCVIAKEELLARRIGRHVVLDLVLPLPTGDGGSAPTRLHLTGEVDKVRVMDDRYLLVVRLHLQPRDREPLARFVAHRQLQARRSK